MTVSRNANAVARGAQKTQDVETAQAALLSDIDATLERVERRISEERTALDAFLQRLNRDAA